jgi:hypothetical protein
MEMSDGEKFRVVSALAGRSKLERSPIGGLDE